MSGAVPRLPATRLQGIGAWAVGMPSWSALRAVARGEAQADPTAPRRPSPDLLAANERRRAPDSVLLALQVAQAACVDAAADPARLPSVFASTHGDLAITDFMCATLARAPEEISPTKFHNSVHNAAAGYWTIGSGCHAAATALSAYRATFAQGLLEAVLQLADGAQHVLLVAYDGASSGPLAAVSRSSGMLGLALVLTREEASGGSGLPLRLQLEHADAAPSPALPRLGMLAENAMFPALQFVDALANEQAECRLDAGPGLTLRLTIGSLEGALQ